MTKRLIVLTATFVLPWVVPAAAVVLAQEALSKNTAAKAPAFKAHVLTRSELDALLDQPGKVLLIDVRRPDEVASNGGFPVYLSVQAAELEKSLAWIPKDRTLVTVSNHAGRGGKAADLLASKGFKVAGTVGAQTYEQEGGKIAHIAAPVSAAKH